MGVTLGIDTATSHLSVAAAATPDVLAERSVGPESGGRPRHAGMLLPAVEECVGEAGGWDVVDLLAVGVGPGTFTGLRIGVASARALAQTRGLPLAGVSSLAALAAGSAGEGSTVLAVLDAKRGEAFHALFGADGEPAWDEAVEDPEALAARVGGLDVAPLAVGDGSLRFRAQLEGAGAVIPVSDDPRHRVLARHVCRLAADAPGGHPDTIEPNYLRRPDAELWRERNPRHPKYEQR